MQDHIKTLIRVRPLLAFQDQPAWSINPYTNTIQCLDTKSIRQKIKLNKQSSSIKHLQQQLQQYSFNFDGILRQSISSQKIYKSYCKDLIVKSIKQCLNCSIMTYGQTCSGKTYTALGIMESPGIIPCTLRDLFLISKDENERYNFSLSLLEIYNQNIYDLFEKQSERKPLKIIEDKKWGCQVQYLRKQKVNGFEDCLRWLQLAQKHRSYGKKENHQKSSRSHTILKIYIQRWTENYQCQLSSINIVDLAGSERLNNNSNEIKQKQIAESKSINKSLFHLSCVIQKLSNKDNQNNHIPYRDSKLTRFLQSSLRLNSQTLIIFCISPAVMNFNQSLQTLRLATKTKKIILQNNTQNNMDNIQNIQDLRAKLNQKNTQCKQLKQQIEQLKKQINQLRKKQESNKIKSKNCQYNVKLSVLMDHQNFQICHLNNQQYQSLLTPDLHNKLNNQISLIKQDFLNKMHRIYEQFTQKIVSLSVKHLGWANNIEGYIKIQQLCFMNMVYEQKSMINYKIPLIRDMLNNFTQDDSPNTNGFYKSLKIYYQNLIKKIQEQEDKSILPQFRQLSEYQLDKTRLNKQFQQESQINSKKIIQSNNGTTSKVGQILYIWGCKKDSRVCKGQKVNEWMVRVENLGKLNDLSCGAHHSLVLNQEGQVYGWGKNQEQQIIPDKILAINIPRKICISQKIISIAAGWSHSLALSESRVIYTWGNGSQGQLGHNNRINMAKPTPINHNLSITKIYAGHSHSGFIDENQDYYAFGFNEDYRLMIKTSYQINKPTRVNLTGIIAAGLGVSHSCLITKDGRVYCGGVGTDGQLGVILNQDIKDYEQFQVPQKKFDEEKVQKICPIIQVPMFKGQNKAVEVTCGQYMTLIINNKKQLYSFGKSSFNRLGHLNKYPSIVIEGVNSLSAGCRHVMCWDNSGKVYGWGFNMYNQLGVASDGDIKTPQIIQELSKKGIVNISCGYFHGAGIAIKQKAQNSDNIYNQ